jgi:hypothetical protein
MAAMSRTLSERGYAALEKRVAARVAAGSTMQAFVIARLDEMDAAASAAERRVTTALRDLMSVHAVHAEAERWKSHSRPEMIRKMTGHVAWWCWTCDRDRDYGYVPGREEGCESARRIAAIWNSHPDYREEWKP